MHSFDIVIIQTRDLVFRALDNRPWFIETSKKTPLFWSVGPEVQGPRLQLTQEMQVTFRASPFSPISCAIIKYKVTNCSLKIIVR
jgi:hypothetical protein